jgi:hypothetical protein
VIHKDVSHHLCSDRKELGPALPQNFAIIGEPQINLVDQRGCLQSVSGILTAHVIGSRAPQFVVHERQQLVERAFIPAAPLGQELRDFPWDRHKRYRRIAAQNSTVWYFRRIQFFLT